ncbi:unnamed protein product [Bemisia tabaci]|uniref:Uncharacterized protein n=1 Tax=Bemisia tabaci TaxID=7038 RepID=A0A9P0EYS1_BEMTA|nr:unnamed protein product [Bemisia tabaci]
MSTGKLDTELQKLKDLLGPSEALAVIRPNMRPCPAALCQGCMKKIGVNMKRREQNIFINLIFFIISLQEVIMDFLNGVTHKILLIHLTNAGTLIPAVSFPLPAKTKVTYFIRGFDDVITAENFHSVVIFGDISPRPVESLAVLFEQIYMPMLSNSSNQKQWPMAVRDDIKKHVYDLKSAVFQVGGLLTGRTLLALPEGADRVYEVEQSIISSGPECHLKSRCILIERCVARGDAICIPVYPRRMGISRYSCNINIRND